MLDQNELFWCELTEHYTPTHYTLHTRYIPCHVILHFSHCLSITVPALRIPQLTAKSKHILERLHQSMVHQALVEVGRGRR